jgi:serine/threonin/tyrosin kinase-like protein
LWGRQQRKLVSVSYIKERETSGQIEYRRSGNEHAVYHDAGRRRAVKVTHVPFLSKIGSVLAYLDRLSACNSVFGDDVVIEGVLRDGSALQVITSQRWIFQEENALPITLVEIDAYFERLNFRQFQELDGQPAYCDPDTKLVVTDAHSLNFIRSEGELVPIDIKLGPPDSALLRLIRQRPWGKRIYPITKF